MKNYKKFLTCLFLITLVSLPLIIHCQTQPNPIIDISTSVHIKNQKDDMGTGFYIISGNKAFLVTARHVLYNEDKYKATGIAELKTNEINLLSFPSHTDAIQKGSNSISINLVEAEQNNKLDYHKNKDVCVLAIGEFSKEMLPKERTLPSENVSVNFETYFFVEAGKTSEVRGFFENDLHYTNQINLGNDAFIIGYPTYLDLSKIGGEQVYEFDKPLIRKGVVSGISNKFNNIIIDGASFYGNSGGAVLEAVKKMEFTKSALKYQTEYKVIGVVSQFIPFIYQQKDNKGKVKANDVSNSGFTVVIPISFAIDLMNKM